MLMQIYTSAGYRRVRPGEVDGAEGAHDEELRQVLALRHRPLAAVEDEDGDERDAGAEGRRGREGNRVEVDVEQGLGQHRAQHREDDVQQDDEDRGRGEGLRYLLCAREDDRGTQCQEAVLHAWPQ